jgi:hypothetical protein
MLLDSLVSKKRQMAAINKNDSPAYDSVNFCNWGTI